MTPVGFIEQLDSGIVTFDNPPLDLPDYWTDIGMNDGTLWSEKEVKDSLVVNEVWNKDIKEAMKQHE